MYAAINVATTATTSVAATNVAINIATCFSYAMVTYKFMLWLLAPVY